MTEITPLYTGAETVSPKPEVRVPQEAHLPVAPHSPSVQPFPMPLITAKETQQVTPDEQKTKQHVAQAHADLTGTGALVDIIV